MLRQGSRLRLLIHRQEKLFTVLRIRDAERIVLGAVMDLVQIAYLLGGTIKRPWVNIPGPGHSSSDRSLGVRFDPEAPDGFWTNSFANDDPEECRAHVKKLLAKSGQSNVLTLDDIPDSKTDHSEAARITAAREIWDQAVPAKETIVETYLLSRNCKSTVALDPGGALRFHPACPFGSFRSPALLALMRDITTGQPVGIHRTALRDDGTGKRVMPGGRGPRMMLGRARHAAVMLQPGGSHLGIAEGIETALSAQHLFEMPVWACLSAPGIAGFPIIKGLNHLTIFADHDAAGIKAARTCAARYKDNSMNGEIKYPPVLGTDWNTEGGA
jgi:putative DNA primase/helicase